MWLTGMGGLHSVPRNCSSASSAPSVLACTSTPSFSVASAFITFVRSLWQSSITSLRMSQAKAQAESGQGQSQGVRASVNIRVRIRVRIRVNIRVRIRVRIRVNIRVRISCG